MHAVKCEKVASLPSFHGYTLYPQDVYDVEKHSFIDKIFAGDKVLYVKVLNNIEKAADMVPMRMGADDIVDGPDLFGEENRRKNRLASVVLAFIGASSVHEYPHSFRRLDENAFPQTDINKVETEVFVEKTLVIYEYGVYDCEGHEKTGQGDLYISSVDEQEGNGECEIKDRFKKVGADYRVDIAEIEILQDPYG
jgi:hypothetical protein